MRDTQIRFSEIERKDLLKSWLIISIVFTIAFTGFSLDKEFLTAVIVAAITAGLGFLLHELAHKFTANYYGCSAEYRANNTMLWVALGIAVVFQAIFIAPGAVMVRGVQSKKENGIISAAGPAMNIVLALLFIILSIFVPAGAWSIIFTYGVLINAWLALFNMIPILPFDGRKVWVWNKPVYITMAAISVLLVFGRSIQ